MRRLPAAAVLTGALLLAAGCSTDPDPQATGAAAPPSAPATAVSSAPAAGSTPGGGASSAPGKRTAGDAALAGNTGAICDQARRTGGTFAATFAQDLKLLIDAASADDPDLAARAEEKTKRDVQNYSLALKDMSQLAADPGLKKALADMGRQVTALKGDVRQLDDKKLGALRSTLDEACGTA